MYQYYCWSVSWSSLRPLKLIGSLWSQPSENQGWRFFHYSHVDSYVEHLVFLHFHYLSPFKWSEKWGIQPIVSQIFPPDSLPVASRPGLPDPQHSRILSSQPFFWHGKRTTWQNYAKLTLTTGWKREKRYHQPEYDFIWFRSPWVHPYSSKNVIKYLRRCPSVAKKEPCPPTSRNIWCTWIPKEGRGQ